MNEITKTIDSEVENKSFDITDNFGNSFPEEFYVIVNEQKAKPVSEYRSSINENHYFDVI